jgi:hypothetical protein
MGRGNIHGLHAGIAFTNVGCEAGIVFQTAHLVVGGGATNAGDKNREKKIGQVISHGDPVSVGNPRKVTPTGKNS